MFLITVLNLEKHGYPKVIVDFFCRNCFYYIVQIISGVEDSNEEQIKLGINYFFFFFFFNTELAFGFVLFVFGDLTQTSALILECIDDLVYLTVYQPLMGYLIRTILDKAVCIPLPWHRESIDAVKLSLTSCVKIVYITSCRWSKVFIFMGAILFFPLYSINPLSVCGLESWAAIPWTGTHFCSGISEWYKATHCWKNYASRMDYENY